MSQDSFATELGEPLATVLALLPQERSHQRWLWLVHGILGALASRPRVLDALLAALEEHGLARYGFLNAEVVKRVPTYETVRRVYAFYKQRALPSRRGRTRRRIAPLIAYSVYREILESLSPVKWPRNLRNPESRKLAVKERLDALDSVSDRDVRGIPDKDLGDWVRRPKKECAKRSAAYLLRASSVKRLDRILGEARRSPFIHARVVVRSALPTCQA